MAELEDAGITLNESVKTLVRDLRKNIATMGKQY